MWRNYPKKGPVFDGALLCVWKADEVLTSIALNPNLTEPVRLISPSGTKQGTLRTSTYRNYVSNTSVSLHLEKVDQAPKKKKAP